MPAAHLDERLNEDVTRVSAVQAVGRRDVANVLCREVVRTAGATGARVVLDGALDWPEAEACYGRVGADAVQLPIRVGRDMLGRVDVSLAEPHSAEMIAHVDSLVSLAGVALGALASVEHALEEARCDFLTGLGNRRAFDERVRQRLAAGDGPVSLVLLDLDDLKRINDVDGHAAGDVAICALATALLSVLRRDDAAFRIGGDEFVVVANVDGAQALELVWRVQAAFARSSFARAASCSAGVASFPDDGEDLETLLAYADAALLAAKRGGKNAAARAEVDARIA